MTDREPLFSKKKPSIFRRIKWRLRDFYWAVRCIPNNIKRLFQWLPIIWKDKDFDYCFFLTLIQYKMKRMRKHFAKHNILQRTPETIKELKLAEELIEQILKGDLGYIEKELDTHREKWGKIRHDLVSCDYPGCKQLDIYSPKAREEGKEEEERAEMHTIYDLGHEREQKDLDLLFLHIRKCIQSWWD